ncbi:MAG: hypothetical protein IPJ01_00585 [Micavibrio sp.]|nr:hypothetical protein [Micavibrio sp.]MBK9561896.1 hypothetical protein [Micavibrio sp.]
MIALILHALGLVMLMMAGHIEYRTRSNYEIRSTKNEIVLKSISNLALLAWIGFGFSAAFWMNWYFALPALLISVALPGNFSQYIIQRNLVEKVIYCGTALGFILCLLSINMHNMV